MTKITADAGISRERNIAIAILEEFEEVKKDRDKTTFKKKTSGEGKVVRTTEHDRAIPVEFEKNTDANGNQLSNKQRKQQQQQGQDNRRGPDYNEKDV